MKAFLVICRNVRGALPDLPVPSYKSPLQKVQVVTLLINQKTW